MLAAKLIESLKHNHIGATVFAGVLFDIPNVFKDFQPARNRHMPDASTIQPLVIGNDHLSNFPTSDHGLCLK